MQRKAEEEKARVEEEQKRIREENEKRKREREEHTGKLPVLKAVKKVRKVYAGLNERLTSVYRRKMTR